MRPIFCSEHPYNPYPHILVGEFFTDSTPPSFHQTEKSLRKQWKIPKDHNYNMIVTKLDDTFYFEFRQKKHKLNVLTSGHYNVNGVIIVIKNHLISPNVDFTVTSFNVAIVGLPSYLYTVKDLKALKSRLRATYFSVAPRAINTIFFDIEVDLKKPLQAGFHVDIEENRFVEFKYKDLGDFCYSCGMIGHVKRRCNQVRFPKERALNPTSKTLVYGPWLRDMRFKQIYETVLTKSLNVAREVEKTLSYAQFFIEVEFNNVDVCKSKSESDTRSIHKFRFPCSYLDTGTESYDVIRNEIYENTPFSLDGFGDNDIESLVEKLKVIKKNEFCRDDDKWLALKLQINRRNMLIPVSYETMLAISKDTECELLILSKISDLIKKRVEENEDLLSLPTWENQIRDVISETGLVRFMNNVSERAKEAMRKAVQMELSSSRRMMPADRSMVSGLERFKVLGSDMDRFDKCMVCIEEMFLGEEATDLPCSHVFHSSCIDKWLGVGHKCPLCGFKFISEK